MIYRLYSYYGSSITQREVSRSFPEYSLEDFKKILRVFNITKASAPFAPHIIEENTPEQLQVMQLREKENDFLRGIEAQRIKQNESVAHCRHRRFSANRIVQSSACAICQEHSWRSRRF